MPKLFSRRGRRPQLRSSQPAYLRPNPIEPLESRVLLSTSLLQRHNDNAGTGQDTTETVLNSTDVNSTDFGKQFATTVDGQIYAQPLYVASLNITTGSHQGIQNVVLVATEHDSLYAINAGTGVILWQDSFLSPTLIGSSMIAPAANDTITTIPSNDFIPPNDTSTNISTEVGITSTPVINAANNVLYVVAQTKEVVSSGAKTGNNYVVRLFTINIADGSVALGGPLVIADTISNSYPTNSALGGADNDQTLVGPSVNGTGAGSVNGVITFDARVQIFRPAVSLVNETIGGVSTPIIFLASGSDGDYGPYHGWILGYNATTLAPVAVFNTTPNLEANTPNKSTDPATFNSQGSIWMSGSAIAADSSGFLYPVTGEGAFDETLNANGFPANGDYGDTFLKLAIDPTSTATSQNTNGWGLKVADYFTPQNEAALDTGDLDADDTGALLLPASAGGSVPLEFGGTKSGEYFLINTNNMGHFNATADQVVQEWMGTKRTFGSDSYYNGVIYSGADAAPMFAYTISNGRVTNPTSPIVSPDTFTLRGATATISGNGSADPNAIVWAIDYIGTISSSTGGQLRAYLASNINDELYNSGPSTGSRDSLGDAVKFTLPTVANGGVYVGTQNQLVAYGLFQPVRSTNASITPSPVTGKTATLNVVGSVGGTINPSNLSYSWLQTSGPATILFSDNNDHTASTSTATFPMAGSYSVRYTFTDTDDNQSFVGSLSFTVSQTATSITVAPATANIAFNNSKTYSATEFDQFGNAMSPQPTFAWSLGSGSVGSIGPATGVYSAGAIAGSATIIATANSIAGNAAAHVAAPFASSLVFTQQPTTFTAGETMTGAVKVAIDDQSGNLLTSDNATITLTVGTGPGSFGTLSAAAVNGVATFANLSTTTAGAYTLSAADNAQSLSGFQSNSFTVNPATATHLAIGQQPQNMVAGNNLSPVPTVFVEDQFGNVVTSGISQIQAIANGVDGKVGATNTYSVVNGTATLNSFQITNADTYTLAITDGALTSATSNSFTVSPNAPVGFRFFKDVTTPVQAGVPISAPVIVELVDTWNNLIPTFQSNVTMSLSTTGAQTLGGTLTVVAVNGMATFNNLIVSGTLIGNDQLIATSSNPTFTGRSTQFGLQAGPLAKLTFTKQPTNAVAGATITPSVAVRLSDQFGNGTQNANSSVTLSITNNAATLFGTTTVAPTIVVSTFNTLSIQTAGTYTLTATDMADGLPFVTSTSFTIAPATASKLVFAAPPSGASAGTTLPTVTVDIEDQFGNIETNDNSTVALASVPSGLTGTTSVSAINGVATFSALSIPNSGSYQLSAADSTDSLSGFTSTSFTVTPAPLPAYMTASNGALYTWNPTTKTLNLTSGTITVIADPGSDEPQLFASGSSSTIVFSPTSGSATLFHIGGLTLTGGAVASVASLGNSRTHNNHDTLVIGLLNGNSSTPTVFSIDAANGSALDLQDNDLVIHNFSNLTYVQALIVLGRNFTNFSAEWNGPGIRSTVAFNIDDPNTGSLGYEDVALGADLNGNLENVGLGFSNWTVGNTSEPLRDDGNDILIKYTYVGDVDLNGEADINDYSILLNNIGTTTGSEWGLGDMDGNGVIDINDYAILLNQIGSGSSGGPDATGGANNNVLL